MADIAFTAYEFPRSMPFGFSPGSAATRTMPDRYNDIINVKDFGAVGNGITDDQAALADAIAYASTLNAAIFRRGALIYLPAGTYVIGSPPLVLDGGDNVSGSWTFMGAGRDATIIKGNTNGYLVKTSGNGGINNITDLTIWNQNTGTSATAFCSNGTGNNMPYFSRVHFIGYYGFVVASGEYNIRISECIFDAPIGVYGGGSIGRADSATPGPLSGSVGAYISQAAFMNNTIRNFDIGLSVRGDAKLIAGNRISRCNTGIYLGDAPDPAKFPPDAPQADATRGTQLFANVIERCGTGIYASNFTMGMCAGTVIQGFEGVPDPAPITTITWAAGTATIQTPAAHNMGGVGTTHPIQLWGFSPLAWVPNGTADQNVMATVVDATHFSYALAGDPTGTPFISGEWNYPLAWGIRCAAVLAAIFATNYMDDLTPWYCGFDLDNFGSMLTGGTTVISMQPRCGWITPGDRGHGDQTSGMGWTFINCGTTGSINNGGETARIAVTPFLKYAALGTALSESEASIVDSQTQNSFSGVVAGGSSTNHYKVRGNGTNWCRIG